MRKYLLAATAVAIATPAFAAANGPYVGVEGGIVFPKSSDLDVVLNNTTATPPTTVTYNGGVNVDYKTGWGVDAIAGYKLGLLRLEAEGGYQRAPVKNVTAKASLLSDATSAAGAPVLSSDFAASKTGITTLMANALLDGDFGSGFGGYIGGGAGHAWASYSGDKDNAWAYQGIAGVRYAVSPNVDVGLKYRYLHTGSFAFNDGFKVNGTAFDTTSKGKYVSNSLLASLVYNFNSRAEPAPVPAAAPAPPPPPPAEASATQTCPDGSVIAATSACPAPPPPPPPPPAPVEKGERG